MLNAKDMKKRGAIENRKVTAPVFARLKRPARPMHIVVETAE